MIRRQSTDPLDSLDPAKAAWEEFRADFANALLIHWLIRDIEYLKPEFADDLWNRFETGFAYREALQEEDLYYGEVPVHTPDGTDVDFWIKYEELISLYDWLYPHHGRTQGPPTDAWRPLILVALHSALERYAKSRHITTTGFFPGHVKQFLEQRGTPLDANTWDVLCDLDASRCVVVHNRGIVDNGYIRKVRNSVFAENERRTVKGEQVTSFAECVRQIAEAIRDAG
jgi:hypothetical protein